MAEVDTLMLSQEHSDIRREQAEQASHIRQQNADRTAEIRYELGQGVNEVVKEGIKGDFATVSAIKDTRHDVIVNNENIRSDLSKQVDAIDDTLTDKLFTIARESADNRAQLTALGYQVRDGFVASSKDNEINALKTQIEMAKQTTYLSDKIDGQAEKTRELLSDLKYHDLNRQLVERSAELFEERHAHHHWRHHAHDAQYQGQWAALNSQLQAFQSQLQETRQNMVNFGTMAGVGQSSTNNQVR